jgi:CBS domain-containing membrane protein
MHQSRKGKDHDQAAGIPIQSPIILRDSRFSGHTCNARCATDGIDTVKLNLKTVLSYLMAEPVPLSNGEKLRSGLASFGGILAVGLISSHFISGPGLPLMVASMGASAVLLFAASHSPLAQPWPLIGGNLLSAAVGVTCSRLVHDPALGAALAVSLSIVLMLLTHSLHPPGGAVSLIPVLGGDGAHALGYHFVLLPVALNVLVIFVAALAINNLLPGRRYPSRPRQMRDEVHKHDDPAAMSRVGVSQADLHSALKDFNAFLDVSEDDLGQIYKMAGMHAYRRKMGEICCADIMSRDLVTAEFGTDLEEAWAQLRYHKIKAIPIIDRARRVIGIVTLVDFLKRADLKTYENFQEKLIKFIRSTSGVTSDKPEVVGQIMTSPVHTAREDAHIVELVPLLSEKGLHHIPIVNAENRLVGMVTQSDLIAALYAGSLARDRHYPSQ